MTREEAKLKRIEELATGNPLKLLFKYSWPALVAMTLNALYAVVDRFYIGHGCGEAAMAGLTLVFPVAMAFGAFGVFVGAGHSAVLSIKLGEGDFTACEKLLGQLVAFKLAFFAVLTPLAWFNIDTILRWCGGGGVSDAAFACARSYLEIVLFSHLFSHLAFGFSAMMRSEGAAKTSMMALVAGFGTNVILDPFFIFGNGNPFEIHLLGRAYALPGLGLGVDGAAWATDIAMFASFVFAAHFYISKKSAVPLRLRRIGFHKGLLLKPCGIGFAPFLQQLLGAAINVALPAAFAKWSGGKEAATTQIASLGVFQGAMILLLMPVFGAQQGIQPIIGYNWGARNFRRVKSALLAGLWATSALCVAACVFQTAPGLVDAVARIFVPSDNPGLLDIAVHDMVLSNCMLWCIGLNIVMTTYFQSIGHPVSAIVLSTMRQGFIMLPVIWFLPYALEDKTFAIWLSMPVSDVACCLATIVPFAFHMRFLSRVREKRAAPAAR